MLCEEWKITAMTKFHSKIPGLQVLYKLSYVEKDTFNENNPKVS